MNLDTIAEAVKAYKIGAPAADAARLDFFKGLYEIQQQRAEKLAETESYVPLGKSEAEAAYIALEPLLSKDPVCIDEVQFFGTCKQIGDYLVENAGLEEDAANALREVDWYKLAGKFDLVQAGTNPPQFVDDCLKNFDALGLNSNVSASLVMMVVTFALRAHIQTAAAQLMSAVSSNVKHTMHHERPLCCPVCGSPAAASHVVAASGIDGRDREQYCSMCGTSWPFERMRCGVCGTENASRLHYFHVDGDSTHRLQNCDECGQYQRVFFEENLSIPVAMEVEDVVMAKLDAIALDPRFRAEAR